MSDSSYESTSKQEASESEFSCADRLKVLADKTRLAVMECLMEEPLYVSQIAELLKVEQSLLSHHLKVLRETNLVVAVRDGKSVLYSISPETLISAEERVINLGCCQLRFYPGQTKRRRS